MAKTGSGRSGVASVLCVGLDQRGMGQIREALGAEAVIAPQSSSFENAPSSVLSSRPDVVVIGFDKNFEEAVSCAAEINQAVPRTHLVALANKADPDRIRAAMRAGYREFVVLPDDAELLRQAVHDAGFAEEPDIGSGDVLVMVGTKGGGGTTTLAVNLAAELAPVQTTCVVDFDFAMGDVAAVLDLKPQHTLHDLIRNIARVDDRMLAAHAAVHASKVHVFAQSEQLDQREEARSDAIVKVLTAIARRYQYVIVDCGSGLEEAGLTALTVADKVMLVITPDVPSVRNAWRQLHLMEQLGVEKKRIKLILNQWDKKNSFVGVADIEARVGRKIDVTVNYDRIAYRATNEGRLLRDIDRRAAICKDLEGLVGLATDEEVEQPRQSSSGFIARLFGR